MGAIKMVEVTRSDFIESIHYEKTISIRVSGFDVVQPNTGTKFIA